MGRQIAVRMSLDDEDALLAFLRSTAPIQIFASFAPTADDLSVQRFASTVPGNFRYYVWNRNFPWHPQFGVVNARAANPADIGTAYLANASAAPLLEIDRADLRSERPGRLYWANVSAAPEGLAYDAREFARWIDTIWRWCRKHGTKDSTDPYTPYVLPDARRQLDWRANEG